MLDLRHILLTTKVCCVANLRSLTELDVRHCGLEVTTAMQLLRELLLCPRMQIVRIFEAAIAFESNLTELHAFVRTKRERRLQLFAAIEVSHFALHTNAEG